MTMVSITVVNNSPGEHMVKAQLLELMQRFDLSRWAWVSDVRIDRFCQSLGQCFVENGTPVIRLRSRRPPTPEEDTVRGGTVMYKLLAIYVHEQLHQYLNLHVEEVNAAIEALKRIYPIVPVGGEEGARSEFSTYLHLLLCTLELDSLAVLIGEDTYRELMQNPRFYRFIYRTVLNETAVLRAVLERYGLTLPFLHGTIPRQGALSVQSRVQFGIGCP